MKQFRQILYNSLIVVVTFFLSILFFSCNYYNFSQPQPVDKENIYEFPPSFRGAWVEKPNSTDLAFVPDNSFQGYLKGPMNPSSSISSSSENDLGAGDSTSFYVEKDYALFIVHSRQNVAPGAWIQTDTRNSRYRQIANSSRKIQYNLASGESDTVDYLIRGDKIYEMTDERFLEKGHAFVFENDTLVVLEDDTICVDLGQNAFLRQLNDNFYVLNIRNIILGEENVWWRLMVLEKSKEADIKIWECNSKTSELASMFYSEIKSDIFYFDSKWSAKEMLGLIKKGYFSVNSTLTKKPGSNK